MKKALFTVAGAILITANLSAQITLTQSSFSSTNLGIDTVLMSKSNSSFPNLTASATGMWDMTVITDTTAVGQLVRTPSTVGQAQYAEGTTSIFGAFTYSLSTQDAIQSDAIYQYGETIDRQPFSIAASTGGATDSVVIDSQNIAYTAPSKTIAFPATYKSVWTNNYSYDFNFQLSIVSVSFDHVPGTIRAFVSEKDSVVGYGKMRVKDAAGDTSIYLDVLQVQVTSNTTDSFFIAGGPAPAGILVAFNFNQGQVLTQATQKYYRADELTPLATVDYNGDATFTHPASAETHTQRLSQPAAVATISAQNSVNVYPNPVTNHTISIDIPNTPNANWTYDLINVTGQTVATAAIKGNHTQIALAPTLASGIYYLRVNNGSQQVCIKPLQIN